MADHRGKKEKLRFYSAYFPLESVDSVVKLFQSQVNGGARPDLTLLSIVLGAVENSLTTSDRVPVGNSEANGNGVIAPFPEPIRFREVEELYQRFSNLLRSSVDLGPFRASGKKTVGSSIDLIKNVSNVIWAGLSSSYYKDRAHIQSIYSFLTGSKLDSFGVALSVVAACQLLGVDDVHLALTEEHAWVVFGEDQSQSVEVTWHGKGVEDKRGQPVTQAITQRSWLYLSGHCVVCDRHMEVAAMVTSINPSIAASLDSPELTSLQQRLLWMLYDCGSLKRYPMAVTNIGDLEEVNPTPGRPSPELLFKEAIVSAKRHYDNMHVYPYTYLGGYYYRLRRFKEALAAWAEASQVISKYNYHRDDEEVYKEFLEIANEIIPNAIRLSVESSLLHRERSDYRAGPVDVTSSVPLLQDPEFCALFLKFYDGICEWEEGSSTPVLHITWATHMLTSLSKFDPNTRALVQLQNFVDETSTVDNQDALVSKDDFKSDRNGNCTNKDLEGLSGRLASQRKPGRPPKRGGGSSLKISATEDVKLNGGNSTEERITKEGKSGEEATESAQHKNSNQEENRDEDQIQCTIKELISRVGDSSHTLDPDPTIVALGHACAESILNPAYLLGRGEPFAAKVYDGDSLENTVGSTYSDVDGVIVQDASADSKFKVKPELISACDMQNENRLLRGNGFEKKPNPVLFLRSTKMKEMKDLLTAKKLNANAIKLHLTAQSQVIVKHSRTGSDSSYGYGKPIKRLRRD